MIITSTFKTQDLSGHTLGRFLQDRRAKLDPASFGFSSSCRRTPGLRREEVAYRANISSAWYVCLEQGRGGAPSADVLDKLAKALLLTNAEREHLFQIGLGRAPESRYRRPEDIEPRLQRVLDKLSPAPAFIKTATWDVVAWNQAATVFWPNMGQLPADQRNTLRMVFLDPDANTLYHDWEAVARMAVAAFRADVARAGAMAEVADMVDELSRSSPAFKKMWQNNDVSDSAHAVKNLRHPVLGTISFECTTFGVDGRQDLTMLVSCRLAQTSRRKSRPKSKVRDEAVELSSGPSELFREEIGTTPARYIEDLRLEATRRQLESTTLSLGGVAQVGSFGSPEILRRVFNRRLGVTPGQYRASFGLVEMR